MKLANVEPVESEPKQALDVIRPQEVQSVTPAQAKVDAVAALTMTAYAKASELRLTKEETDALQAMFPDEAFQSGAAGKENLIYIEHAHLRDRFNQVFGMGQWAIVPRNRWAEAFKTSGGKEGSRVYVEAMLLVRGCFVGEAVGTMEYYPHNAGQDYSDAVEGAKTAALRRCAKELGVGLQAWKKEFCEGWWERKRAKQRGTATPRSQQNNSGVSGTERNRPGNAGETSKTVDTVQSGVSAKNTRVETEPPKQTNAARTEAVSNTDTVKPARQTEYATDTSRLRFLNELTAAPGQDGAVMVKGFCIEAGMMCDNEELIALPLEYVPVTKGQLSLFITAIHDWEGGGEAVRPFVNALSPEEHAKPKSNLGSGAAPIRDESKRTSQASASHPSTPAPARGSVEPAKREWFFDVPIHIPRKGIKMGDYAVNMDTIGSLYEARHGTDEEADYLRKRLFALVKNFVGGWEKKDGTKVPPSAIDLDLRKALDAFAAYLEAKG